MQKLLLFYLQAWKILERVFAPAHPCTKRPLKLKFKLLILLPSLVSPSPLINMPIKPFHVHYIPNFRASDVTVSKTGSLCFFRQCKPIMAGGRSWQVAVQSFLKTSHYSASVPPLKHPQPWCKQWEELSKYQTALMGGCPSGRVGIPRQTLFACIQLLVMPAHDAEPSGLK